VFDKTGKPLTSPDGITFDGKLGLMQGIIITPSGEVWALGLSKNQLLHFPKGDCTQGRIVGEGRDVELPARIQDRDQISPRGGYVGGGLQMQTDLAIGPAGDVRVMNNWHNIESCFGVPPEPLSTRCGGQGVTIYFWMTKPVRVPQIGPACGY
jgi:hypothetical protein